MAVIQKDAAMTSELTTDLIFYNGRIHTQDEACPLAAALAVSGKTITAVGPDRDILSMAGRSTRIIDLENRLVLPGFWDTHFHFFGWAVNIDSLDLAKARSFADMEKMIQVRAKDVEPGAWILGLGFNESEWPENRMPSRNDLDGLAPDNPVCIWRCDCHLAVANSRALALAGIHDDFIPPEGAVIGRDAQGVPTGILKELAPNLITAQIPKLARDQLRVNMKKAMAHCHGIGLTAIHDVRLMGGEDGADALAAFQALHASGQLKLRCFVNLPGEKTDQAVELGLTSGFGDEILRIGWLKFFADGAWAPGPPG